MFGFLNRRELARGVAWPRPSVESWRVSEKKPSVKIEAPCGAASAFCRSAFQRRQRGPRALKLRAGLGGGDMGTAASGLSE